MSEKVFYFADMKRINLYKLVKKSDISRERIALNLFPDNSHPKHALNRHMVEGIELKESQILKLADLLDCTVLDLFEGWNAKKLRGDTLILQNGDKTAELNRRNWVLRIFDKDQLLVETAIIDKYITITELLNKLDKLC